MDKEAIFIILAALVFLTVIVAMALVYAYMTSPSRKQRVGPDVLDELRAMREEMARLRQQNNDVILSLDSSVRHLEQRLDQLEEPALSTGRQGEESVLAARRR